MSTNASDLIPNYSFTVRLDMLSFGFKKVSNLTSTIDVETIIDGGTNDAPVIVRKPKKNPDMLILEKGLSTTMKDLEFGLLFKEGRKIDNISIDVKRDGKTVRMFSVSGGVIVGREFSPLDSMEGDVLLESLKIAHTGITEVPLPFGV